ncbi:homing endonuclease, partial [Tuber indicum]
NSITKTDLSQVNLILNPYYITGFSDAEACFSIGIKKNPKSKIGWTVTVNFAIHLHYKEKALLEQIQLYFGVGAVFTHVKDSSCQYRV